MGQRCNHIAQVPGRSDGQAGGSVLQLAAERRIVIDLGLKNAEAGCRTFLPVVTEGGAHQVFNGLIPVGHGRDNEGILATGLGEQAQVRPPVLEETCGLDAASQDDRRCARIGDECLAHSVIRAGQKLQDCRRDARCP